mgnify:FL=1
MIKLNDVTFKYDKVILENINLEIFKSKVTYIVGNNGSGKSTLANIMSGLLFPSSGKVSIDNIDINKKTNNKLVREKIGMVFQNPSNQILFTKVYDDINFILENMNVLKEKRDKIIKNCLEKVNMLDYINFNPYNLSGGQKQRVAIASQLSLNPDYLIFDESTSMLDINGKNDMYSLIKKLKKDIGIICITNNMDELVNADEVIIIDNKNAFKYDINDILNDTNILKEHNLDIPFMFKIANKLNIKNIKDVNEEFILGRIEK